MFWTQNLFLTPDKNFFRFRAAKSVSAIHVFFAAKLGNICIRNNVSKFSQAFMHQFLYDGVKSWAGPFLIWWCKLLCKQGYKDLIPRKNMDLWRQIRNKPMPHLIRSWNKCCVALYKFWFLGTVYHTHQLKYSTTSENPDHYQNVNFLVSWGFHKQLEEKLKSKQDKPNPSLVFLVLKLEDSSSRRLCS